MRVAVALVIAACAAAAPALAQPADPLAAASRAVELADQNRRSEALNVEVNRKNAEVDARNAAAKAAYAKAVSDWRAQVQAQDAAAALARSTYLRALSTWRVEACKAGDVNACAGPVG